MTIFEWLHARAVRRRAARNLAVAREFCPPELWLREATFEDTLWWCASHAWEGDQSVPALFNVDETIRSYVGRQWRRIHGDSHG